MRIYLAASSKSLKTVRKVARLLEHKGPRRAGHTITKAWWSAIENAPRTGPTDADVPDEYAHTQALEDLAAIRACEVLVYLDDGETTFGAPLEIGYAIARGVPIFALGRAKGRIWERLAGCWTQFETVHELLDALNDADRFFAAAPIDVRFTEDGTEATFFHREIVVGRVSAGYWTVYVGKPTSGQRVDSFERTCERTIVRIRTALGAVQ